MRTPKPIRPACSSVGPTRSTGPRWQTDLVGRVGIVGAGPAGLFAANVLLSAGIDCEVLERLDEESVRARARAGLIEDRTARLLDAHGLAGGMLERGKTLGSCEFRRG